MSSIPDSTQKRIRNDETGERTAATDGFFDAGVEYVLAAPLEFADRQGKVSRIDRIPGRELNLAGRVIYAEATGDWTARKLGIHRAELENERRAIASVIFNRLGAVGLRGGIPGSLAAVLEAPGAFQSVTGCADETSKYRSCDSSCSARLSQAEQDDLRACLEVVRDLVGRAEGAWYDFTSSRAGVKGRGTVVGGSRFWKDEEIYRLRAKT